MIREVGDVEVGTGSTGTGAREVWRASGAAQGIGGQTLHTFELHPSATWGQKSEGLRTGWGRREREGRRGEG